MSGQKLDVIHHEAERRTTLRVRTSRSASLGDITLLDIA